VWEAGHYADRKPESDKPERAQPLRVTGPPLLPWSMSNFAHTLSTEMVSLANDGQVSRVGAVSEGEKSLHILDYTEPKNPEARAAWLPGCRTGPRRHQHRTWSG
jgi:hypothetical protein